MRVALETYAHFARFGDDIAKQKKGEPPGSPFLILPTSAGSECGDAGDGDYYAGDGACRAMKLDWMIVAGHCWSPTAEPIALGEQLVVQMHRLQVQPRAGSNLEYVSQNISRRSEIPCGDIES